VAQAVILMDSAGLSATRMTAPESASVGSPAPQKRHQADAELTIRSSTVTRGSGIRICRRSLAAHDSNPQLVSVHATLTSGRLGSVGPIRSVPGSASSARMLFAQLRSLAAMLEQLRAKGDE
jgi:hypothetical protein